jgi:hypothetical protein
MADHIFSDMPSSVALEIVEMQIQFATSDVPPLLSMPIDQWNNHVVSKVCHRSACLALSAF